MHWLNKLKVGPKLIGSFLIVSMIAAIIGLIGVRSVTELNGLMATMYNRDIIGLRLASNTSIQLLSAERAIRNAMLVNTREDRQRHFQAANAFLNGAQEEIAQLDPSFTSPEGRALLQDARHTLNEYEKALQTVMAIIATEIIGTPPTRSMRVMSDDVRPIANKIATLTDALIERKLADSYALDMEAVETHQRVMVLMIGLTIFGVILAIVIGAIITRVLTRQLGGEPLEVANIAYSIAEGNLNTKIDAARAPKGSVVDAMSLMQASLRKVVLAVRASSDSIASGSSQIATGNADLSQRTEEQAANITETAAAMEEMSSTVKSNADVARQAAHLSSSASTAAVEGGVMVDNVVTTMDDVNTASKKIVEIIDVIDSIAFQTNILALNAAVEAARAGEEGRGFAVVASEVRNLAQRSASAAQDIKNLIDDSVNKVETGTKMVHDAGSSMGGIVTQVKHVTDLINDISAATTEQTTGLSQINAAVVQLSDVTQQNAALVEQSAAAAESLSQQAQQLVEVVRVFKLGADDPLARAKSAVSTHASKRNLTAPRHVTNRSGAAPTTPGRPQLTAGAAPKLAPAHVNDDWEEF